MKGSKFRFSALLCVFLLALAALGGCGGSSHNTPDPNPSPNPQPAGVLEAWKGEWKSANSAMNSPEVDSLCENVAKELSAYTKKGVKSLIGNMYRTDFVGMKIDGSTVTFMDDQNGSLGTLSYVSRGIAQRKFGEEPLNWHQFEVSSAKTAAGGVERAQALDLAKSCKYLVMLELGSDSPDGVKHFHMRYGSESFEALIDNAAMAMWWPTFCKPESLSTLMKEMATPEAVKAFVGMLKNRNPLEAWKGAWVNPISFLDDPAMKPVYEAVSKKAAEKGKTYTPEAVKSFFKETMLRSDFAGGAKVEGNSFTFLDDKGGVKATVSYVFDGIEVRKFGEYPIPWSVFKAEAEGPYKVLTLLPAGKDTPDGFTHFHMRYGDKSAEALLDDPALVRWFPTLCEPTTTAARFAKDMLDGADEMVGMLP